MSSDKTSLDLLIPNPTDPKTWFEILEKRRKLISPHLDRFTLYEIRTIRCLKTQEDYDLPVCVDEPQYLGEHTRRKQGMFFVSRPDTPLYETDKDSSTIFIWGLARSGEWLLTTIELKIQGQRAKKREIATQVMIETSTAKKISEKTGIHPQQMWSNLGAQIKKWEKSRRYLHEIAAAMAAIVNSEETVLSLVD